MAGYETWILFLVCLVLSQTCSSSTHFKLPDAGVLPNGGKIWALLVAGSNGYYNYRHQADVCHAYQILHKNGISDENIIVMMYDDIARSSENPTPNILINHPDGPNVYSGVPIDYSKEEVNSTNFLAVLAGDKDVVENIGTGRVINSGPKDHIFVNFVDHGAPGFLCFPSDELHAKRLKTALKGMAAKNLFSKMVFYVEACESGSLFDDILPDDLNIFVMTAADPQESSFACFYDKLRGTYLGDVFSVKWMEDSDNENLAAETLHHQFQLVRSETNTSHVEEYGDLDIGSLPVAYFQGYSNLSTSSGEYQESFAILDAVNSRDVPLEILKRQLESTVDKKLKKKLQFKIHRLQKLRQHLDAVVYDIVSHIAHGDKERKAYMLESQHTLSASNLDCYESLVKHFSSNCFKISENPYALTRMEVFINMCSAPFISTQSARKAMDDVCVQERRLTGIH